MLIRCPKCSAGYNIPAEKIGAGRSLRCVKCGNEWHQTAEKEEETPPVAPPVQETTEETAAPKPKESTSSPSLEEQKAQLKKKIILSSVGGVSGILVILALLILLQGTMEETFPSWKGFYASVGLGNSESGELTNTGLSIPEDSIERTLSEGRGQPTLIFTGKVRNTNTETVQVPEVRVTLLDEQGIEVDHWPAIVKKSTLEAGETTTWVCRFFNPPLERISEHKVTFH